MREEQKELWLPNSDSLKQQRDAAKRKAYLRKEGWRIFWKELAAFRVSRAAKLLLVILTTSRLVGPAAKILFKIYGRYAARTMSKGTKAVSVDLSRGTRRARSSSK